MASDIRIAGCTCDMVVNPYGTGQIVEVSYSDPKPIAAEGYEIVSYEPERCQAITENTVSTVTEGDTELYRYETGPSHVITEDTSGDVEYSGATNEQFESTEGYVRSLTVEGKSEKWNQLVNTLTTTTTDGITTSYDPTTHLFTVKNDSRTANYSSGSTRAYLVSPYEVNHKYAIIGDDILGVCVSNNSSSYPTTMNAIFQASTSGSIALRISKDYDFVTTHPVGDVTTFHMVIVDLTALYGAGNEPTVNAFKATDVYKAKLAAGELYDYDAGSLVSIEGVGVQSGGTTTTITTPLRSAGSVHDELQADADSWTVERRVGVVDLGTLTWTSPTTGIYYGSTVPNMKKGAWNNNNPNNCMVAGYTTLATKQVYEHPENDMSVALWDTDGRVGLRNNTIADAAALATSLSGVLLYYELATPTQDTETSMDTIEIGSAFTVATDLDSTFELTVADSMVDVTSYFGYDCFTDPILAQVAYGSTANFVLETYVDFNSIVVRDSDRVEYTLSDISCAVHDTVVYAQHPETGGWGSEQQKNLYIPWQDIR